MLTVRETADVLAVSSTTVWRLADRGDLPRVRVGPAQRLVRFRADDVEALIHPSTTEAHADNVGPEQKSDAGAHRQGY